MRLNFNWLIAVGLLIAPQLNGNALAQGAPTVDEIIKQLTPKDEEAGEERTRSFRSRGISSVNPPSAPSVVRPAAQVDLQTETFFEFNKAELTAHGKSEIDNYIKALTSRSLLPFSFRIVGHTDDVGSHEYNDDLSRRRANAVRDYMVLRNVDPRRLDVSGEGKRKLKNPANPAGSENRRVEILNMGKSSASN
jgi:OmpA-OmpF porin, OOP family